MIIFIKGLLVIVSLLRFITFAKAITYNVIASPLEETMDVAVVIDDVIYPLKVEYGILYKGEAPSAKKGYTYAFVDKLNNNKIQLLESFMRSPLEDNELSTVHEFFNRSSNIYDIERLPQVLPPLNSIHRINSELHKPNQIRTIHIYGDQISIDKLHSNQLEDLDFKLNVAYFGLRDIQIFENVKISLSGTSTRWDPKLSYSLKLDKKNDTSLFGYKNLKLRSLTKDPSYIRENVCYNVFQSAGLAVSGFSYVRLFINNQPIGLFGLIETFQDPWAAAVFANGDPNYKAGRMFQGRGANIKSLNHGDRIHVSDLHYESDISNYNAGQYDIKTGSKKKENESYKELQEFTKFINESTAAVRKAIDQSEWEKVLDVNGLLRAMALEDILGLADSYMTLSNNFYLYKDPNQKGRITYIPADMDSTLGFTIFFNLSSMTSGSYASHPAILFRPLTKAVLAYPDYLKNYKELRFMLTKNLVNSDTMNPYIDSVVKMIRKDVEWDSTLKRVGKSIPQSERIFGPKEKNVTNIFSQIKQYFPPGYDLGYIREREPTRALPLDDAVGSLNISKSMLSVKEFIAQKSLAILQSQQE